jgi:uncharacterized membrane protein HdeD (DUF308 family)
LKQEPDSKTHPIFEFLRDSIRKKAILDRNAFEIREVLMTTDAGKRWKRIRAWAMVWAILLAVAGLIALILPFEVGISIAIVLSILIIAAGVFHLIFAVVAGSFGGYLWRTIIGILYMAGGIYLFMHPLLSLVSFTIVLGVVFLVEGILQVIAFFAIRKLPGAGWSLFDGIVTILLAVLILVHWPSSAAWAISTLVGVNLLLSGITRFMHLLAHRHKAAAAVEPAT